MIPETSAGNQLLSRAALVPPLIAINPLHGFFLLTFALRPNPPRQCNAFGCGNGPMHRPMAWDGSASFGGLRLARAWGVATDQICRASASGIDLGLASQVLAGLAATRLCVAGAADDSWICEYAPGELKRLVRVLSGADHFRRMRLNPAAIELAVAMPLLPSHLEKELASTSVVPEVF